MCRSRKGSLYYMFLQLPTSHVTVTQQGSVFGDAAGTRRHGQALNALAVTQSQWRPDCPAPSILPRYSFQKRPWLLPAAVPSVTCLPSQGCVCTTGFPSRGQVLSPSCHSLAQLREVVPSLGHGPSMWRAGGACLLDRVEAAWGWEGPWGTTWHQARGHQRGDPGAGALGGYWGGAKPSAHTGDHSTKVQGHLRIRERLKELQGVPGTHPVSSNFPCRQMGKLRPREKKGSWPRQHSRFFQPPPWMGTQIPHGAWPPQWPAGKLGSGGGRVSLGTWVTLRRRPEGPLVGTIVLRRGGAWAVDMEQHGGGGRLSHGPV